MAYPSDLNIYKAIQAMQLGIQYLQHAHSKTQDQLAKAQEKCHKVHQKRKQLKQTYIQQKDSVKVLKRLQIEVDLNQK